MIAGLRTAIAVLLAAAALYAMQHTTPYYSDITAPIVISGEEGKKVEAGAFSFQLRRVRVARQLSVESFGGTRTFSTSGVWIVAEAEAEATKSSLGLTFAEWSGGNGLRYALTSRLPSVTGFMPSERLEPGLARPVLLAFEAPEAALDGGSMTVARSMVTPLDEEISILAKPIAQDRIEPAITVRRNREGPAWTLLPE